MLSSKVRTSFLVPELSGAVKRQAFQTVPMSAIFFIFRPISGPIQLYNTSKLRYNCIIVRKSPQISRGKAFSGKEMEKEFERP